MKQLIAYVNPQGPLPEIADSRRGVLLVIGGAACVWDDLRRYDSRHGSQDRMAINDITLYYPGRLNHGVGLHTDKVHIWSFNQRQEGARKQWPPILTHSHLAGVGVDTVWPLRRDGGTSGLFGTFIGLLIGYERIVLAGIPCDGSPRFFDPPWAQHNLFGIASVQEEWTRVRDAVPLFKERVRSLSGNTAKWLGEPEETFYSIASTAPKAKPLKKELDILPSGVTVITPTGDRPEALTLLRRWMAAQTMQPAQWLIIDDGKKQVGHIHEAQVVRREPQPSDDPCTLGINLKTALPLVEHGKVLIMEDDDWYSPNYIETMAALLDEHELVGVTGTKCYHIQVPGFRPMGRFDHASLSQTGFRKSFIPQVERAIPGDCQVDLRIWWTFHAGKGHLIDGSQKQLHCAIKGLPGRAGAGCAHTTENYQPDHGYQKFQEWCADWEFYKWPFKLKDRLVVYTAIAGNGGRDILEDPAEAVPAVDYVCFTDQPFISKVWEIRPFNWIHPKEAVRTAKHPKINPHLYFPKHELSLWVDGNITPTPALVEAARNYLLDYDLALHRHPYRTCLYKEAEVVSTFKKDHPKLIDELVKKCRRQLIPEDAGLYECGLLFRRHHAPIVKKAMSMWWQDIKDYTNSDQVSWAAIMWKEKIRAHIIEGNLRYRPDINYRSHDAIIWGYPAMNKVTAIVVTYNSKELLQQTIVSLRQYYRSLPIILVDGSTPGNPCREFVESLNDTLITKIICNHNIGHGRGMCAGLEMCKTPYALLVDSDVIVREDILESMLKMMEPDTYGVGCLHNVGRDGEIFGTQKNHKTPIPYLHPFFTLLNVANYRKYAPFVHHGAPCYKSMVDIFDKGLSKKVLKQFPGLHHCGGELDAGIGPGPVEHRMQGTRKIAVAENGGGKGIEGDWQ